MDVLPLHFRTLWFCGIWYEETEKLNIFRKLYRIVVIIFIYYFTFTISGAFFLSLEESDVSDMADALFLAATFITLCFKIVNFVFRREDMIEILKDFRSPYCLATNEDETQILDEYSHSARKLFIYLLAFVLSDVGYFVSTFVVKIFNNVEELPYRSYQFYNISSKEIFFPTAIVQVACVLYSVLINIAMDTLNAGLLILMTGQLKLNAYRLSKLNQDNVASINSCIAHNILIHNAVDKIESFIIGVVVPFLFFSLLSICTSVFQLSEHSIFSFEFVGILTFSICILLQVLVYCWFGNELMLKSQAITNAIYKSDWVTLNPQYRKSLQIMMICNKDGRIVSYGGQCSLSLDTFVWIIRTSYASISLLQQMND